MKNSSNYTIAPKSNEDLLNVDKLTYEKFLDKYDGYINGVPSDYTALLNFYGKGMLLPNSWDFVEQYLPNYYSSEDVALSNDLLVIEENGGNIYDVDSAAFFVLNDMCGGDWTKAEVLRTELDGKLYKESIMNYIAEFNEKLENK